MPFQDWIQSTTFGEKLNHQHILEFAGYAFGQPPIVWTGETRLQYSRAAAVAAALFKIRKHERETAERDLKVVHKSIVGFIICCVRYAQLRNGVAESPFMAMLRARQDAPDYMKDAFALADMLHRIVTAGFNARLGDLLQVLDENPVGVRANFGGEWRALFPSPERTSWVFELDNGAGGKFTPAQLKKGLHAIGLECVVTCEDHLFDQREAGDHEPEDALQFGKNGLAPATARDADVVNAERVQALFEAQTAEARRADNERRERERDQAEDREYERRVAAGLDPEGDYEVELPPANPRPAKLQKKGSWSLICVESLACQVLFYNLFTGARGWDALVVTWGRDYCPMLANRYFLGLLHGNRNSRAVLMAMDNGLYPTIRPEINALVKAKVPDEPLETMVARVLMDIPEINDLFTN